MTRPVLLDTGPLVAYLSQRDSFHQWAQEQWIAIEPPFLSCEAVMSEAWFLLHRSSRGVEDLLEALKRSVIALPFRLEQELQSVSALMLRYANVPMSLADACLVRMAELHEGSAILTLDSDFRVYRKNGRQQIPLLIPETQ